MIRDFSGLERVPDCLKCVGGPNTPFSESVGAMRREPESGRDLARFFCGDEDRAVRRSPSGDQFHIPFREHHYFHTGTTV